QIGATGFSTCTSPQTFSALVDGLYTFQVHAKDPAGNFSSISSYTWEIDTVPPQIIIKNTPNNPSNQSQPTFGFSSPETSATFECQTDGTGFSGCSSPLTYQTPLSDGSHTFQVRATDLAGNTTKASDIPSYTWVVDTIAPDLTITAYPPAPPVTVLSSDFAFSSTDTTAIFMCMLGSTDNIILPPYNQYYPCSAHQTFTDLADGVYHLIVYSQDPAGNQSVPQEKTWELRQPPRLTHPSNPSFDIVQVFGFTSTSASSFECKLDWELFATCTSPVGYFTEGVSNPLSYGSHTFNLRAIDAKGNISAPLSYTWVVNDTVVTSKPSAITSLRDASFAFSTPYDDPGTTFECALDGDINNPNFQPCSSPQSYSNLALGAHTFMVRATKWGTMLDSLGRVVDAKIDDPTPYVWQWTIKQQERLINGGFNSYTGTLQIPTGWTGLGFTRVDGKDTLNKKEGIASVKMVGNGKLKTLTQTWNPPIAGWSGAPFKFSFYIKGTALPVGGSCSAQVILYRVIDGLTKTYTVPCPLRTYGFTQKPISFSAPWPFTKVVVKFTFNKPSGTVWFDMASLIE
ncbi:MAG: Ig-like domain-containing protein, partial [Anaerolineales bacterium]